MNRSSKKKILLEIICITYNVFVSNSKKGGFWYYMTVHFNEINLLKNLKDLRPFCKVYVFKFFR